MSALASMSAVEGLAGYLGDETLTKIATFLDASKGTGG